LIVGCKQRHRLIGGTEGARRPAEAGLRIVVSALELPEAECQMRAYWRLARLSHLDLLQDEVEVHAIEGYGHDSVSCPWSASSTTSVLKMPTEQD
jgi:hypothetical protein